MDNKPYLIRQHIPRLTCLWTTAGNTTNPLICRWVVATDEAKKIAGGQADSAPAREVDEGGARRCA